MKLRLKMLSLSVGLMLTSHITLGDTAHLNDINYNFDQTKVSASADTFHFLRSFVDYYYGLIANNTSSLNIVKKTGDYVGWCVGDAHAENFGILLQENGSPLFTMNDMDDSGPCPVAYDLFRILVSSRLYMPNIDTQEIIKSYSDGLLGKNALVPDSIKSMTTNAVSAGFQIAAKDLKGNAFKRKGSMDEVDSATKGLIANLLQAQYRIEGLSVLDIVATSKIGGGSGGLLRYEVLITNSKKQMIHLELKEQVIPAIAPVANGVIPDHATRLKETLRILQGQGFSHYYNVFNVQNKTMFLRPKFAGNIGMSLSDSSGHDNKEIINFDAYVLGRLHANTINVKDYSNALNSMSSDMWEKDISAMITVFNKRFNELKNESL